MSYSLAAGSAGTAFHHSVDALDFYGDVLHLVPDYPGAILMDIGGGIGRDAMALRNYTDYFAEIFSIDPDPHMKEASQRLYPNRFEYIRSAADYEVAALDNPPYFIEDALPDLARLERIVPGLKADFMLCNAVMMFVPPDRRAAALETMLDRLSDGGHLVMRYRTVDLKPGMHPISVREISGLASKFNRVASVAFPHAVADPKGRVSPRGMPYLWHQAIFTKLDKS